MSPYLMQYQNCLLSPSPSVPLINLFFLEKYCHITYHMHGHTNHENNKVRQKNVIRKQGSDTLNNSRSKVWTIFRPTKESLKRLVKIWEQVLGLRTKI